MRKIKGNKILDLYGFFSVYAKILKMNDIDFIGILLRKQEKIGKYTEVDKCFFNRKLKNFL